MTRIAQIIILIIILTGTVQAQWWWYYDAPEINTSYHDNGKIGMSVTNAGWTGLVSYPIKSGRYGHRYAWGTELWIGGIVDGDTLVSVSSPAYTWWGQEFWPRYAPAGSIRDASPYDQGLQDFRKRELKFISEYTDTSLNQNYVPYNDYDYRLHKPLGIKITQTSYSYSYTYAEDLILINYKIQNISDHYIDDVVVGFYQLGDVTERTFDARSGDDIEGYLRVMAHEFPELGMEEVNIAWVCDYNGKGTDGSFGLNSVPHVIALAPVSLPEENTITAFNWWVELGDYTWGPRKIGSYVQPLKLFQGQLGMPYSDKDMYYLMATQEIDYGGYEAAFDRTHIGWLPPSGHSSDIANGHYVRYVTSFGKYDMEPGEIKEITMAHFVGENFHTRTDAIHDLLDPQYPFDFLRYLNSRDMLINYRWAKSIFDNPGVDTDGDGDSGKFIIRYDPTTNEDHKFYYAGDGVPDFKGPTPPPPPDLRVYPEDNKVVLRWNGRAVEEFYDSFTSVRDFEGYRVYIARSELEDEITLMSSYDKEDYSRYQWNFDHEKYELTEIPFTIDSLRVLYGEDFDPLSYNQMHPLIDKGRYYLFKKVDYNVTTLDDPGGIHKLYPDATLDTSDVDEEGRMRYYEYQYIAEGLLSTVPYYFSVTSFDFGFPAKSLEALESSAVANQTMVYAVDRDHVLNDDGSLNVYVYPNPYRIDGEYRHYGFENRGVDMIPDRTRNIFFANLPNKCTISIYTLDGDLVKRIEHNQPPGSGVAQVERFDMINRNTQTIESGLYYWHIDSEFGTQIGKLAIIR